MMEIKFRFVIELSEDTRDFLWQLVDEMQGINNDEAESGDRSDPDSSV